MGCAIGLLVACGHSSEPTDRLLQQRNEQDLRAEQQEHDDGQPGLHEEHVAEHAQQDPAVEQGLGDTAADEAPDRLHLRHDDRDRDAFLR
jgi:hypothetical protein